MIGNKEQWLGPGETARRLGVSTKALRVYEREKLVVPRRTESGWRTYGPGQIARLHQIIVLRDLGLSLKAIRKLIGSQSRLRDILRLQRESLLSKQGKIARAIAHIEAAQRQLEDGRDLSLDDLASLVRETVVQQSRDNEQFVARLEALIAEKDPTGQASRAFDDMKADMQATIGETQKAELKAMMAEAVQLEEAGDINSEAAKDFIRRFQSHVAGIRRPLQEKLMLDAFAQTAAEAQARSQALSFDPAVVKFLVRVKRGMKERGELDS